MPKAFTGNLTTFFFNVLTDLLVKIMLIYLSKRLKYICTSMPKAFTGKRALILKHVLTDLLVKIMSIYLTKPLKYIRISMPKAFTGKQPVGTKIQTRRQLWVR